MEPVSASGTEPAEEIRASLSIFRTEIAWAEDDLAELRSRLADLIGRFEQTADGADHYVRMERELRERATQLAEALVAGERFREEAARHLSTYSRAFDTMRSRLIDLEQRAKIAHEDRAIAEEQLAARTEQLAWALTRLERLRAAAFSGLSEQADAFVDMRTRVALATSPEPERIIIVSATLRSLLAWAARRAIRELRHVWRGFTRLGRATPERPSRVKRLASR